jgi:hypothetical protein
MILQAVGKLTTTLLGLMVVENRSLPPSSRYHESGVWQGLYMLNVEVIWILRGATGRYGGATGGNLGPCKRDFSDVSINESPIVIWKITRESSNL